MKSNLGSAQQRSSTGCPARLNILLAGAMCVLIAGCGGGSSTSAAVATRTPVSGSAALAGAGGASNPVAIAALPASGPCAASGTPALQAPGLNSQIDCAP